MPIKKSESNTRQTSKELLFPISLSVALINPADSFIS